MLVSYERYTYFSSSFFKLSTQIIRDLETIIKKYNAIYLTIDKFISLRLVLN